MSKHLIELMEIMDEIKKGGWYNSTRNGPTGIGKTFEDLLGKVEDNKDAPDFHDIEIKTHEEASASMITLFTKSPTYPRCANTFLRKEFGKLDEHGNMILHVTVSGNRRTNSAEYNYNFKATVDYDSKLIRLSVYDKCENLVNNSVFWSFDAIQNQINKKLQTIAIVSCESRIFEGEKQYKYNDIDLVTQISANCIAEAIQNGDLKVDIRIGAYKSGKNKGKTHDHGTGFRINMEKLLKCAVVKRI